MPESVVWLLDEHLLSLTVGLPAVTAIALAASGLVTSFLLPGSQGLPARVWRPAALASSGCTLLLATFGLWAGFDPEVIGVQFVERVPWADGLGIHYFAGIDGISLVLVVVTAFVTPVVLLASWTEISVSPRAFAFWVLVLESGLLAVFAAQNLFQFYVAWELAGIPLLFLVGIWGGDGRVRAAVKLAVMSAVGSGLLWLAFLVLYWLHADQNAGVGTFDLIAYPGAVTAPLLGTAVPTDAGDGTAWWQTQRWLFAAFAAAFAVKAALPPLHTWLPKILEEAPTAASALVLAVVVQLGAYGFLRLAIPLFPSAAQELVPWMYGLALTGVVGGALIAAAQQDLGRLVAYAALVQTGLVLLGIFSFTLHGLAGAIVQMLSHALVATGLVVVVGFVKERRATRDIDAFGGLAKPMPVCAVLFGVIVLAGMGLPVLSHFVGTFLVLLGLFEDHRWIALGAAAGLAAYAAGLISMYRRVMLGEVHRAENRGLIDLGLRERGVVLALVIPILWIGIHPNPLLRRIEPAAIELLRNLEEGGDASLLVGDSESAGGLVRMLQGAGGNGGSTE